MQFTLNLENLENIVKDEIKDSEYLPIVIVTNGNIPLDMDLTMFDQKVKLVEDKNDSDLIKKGHPFISIVKFKLKDKTGKAEFDMTFNDDFIIKVKLKKEDIWVFKSFYSKSKKKKSKQILFERDF